MAKIVTDKELLEIVGRIINGNEIDDQDTYFRFIESLASVICEYCGGTPGHSGYDEDVGGYCIAIHPDENIPAGGGIWHEY